MWTNYPISPDSVYTQEPYLVCTAPTDALPINGAQKKVWKCLWQCSSGHQWWFPIVWMDQMPPFKMSDEISTNPTAFQVFKLGDIMFLFTRPHGPFCLQISISIPAWMSKYTHYKVWDEITYQFPNFIGCNIEVWGWISNLIQHFTGHVITYLCWDWN